jgi:hypothetical protein
VEVAVPTIAAGCRLRPTDCVIRRGGRELETEPLKIRQAVWALGLLGIAAPLGATAAEVQFEGFYQTRGRLFDTLSLDREIATSEKLSWYVQHRLWLRPKFLITDHVGLYVDIKALDNVHWGDQPSVGDIPYLDAPPTLAVLHDNLDPPVSTTDARKSLVNLSLWRAWAQIHTKYGTFKFGRMPLHWGLGVWQNEGLGTNQEYGDSADRISWEHMLGQVWLRVAADVHTEGLINQTDDTTSFNAAAAYRTERMEGGLNFQYRRRNEDGAKFDLYSIDGAFDLAFGPVGLKGEVIAQFGNGDLDINRNDFNLLAVGAVIDAGIEMEKFKVNLEAGVATGDGDLEDKKLRSFTFDRDFNVGMFMFEQPMPTLQATVATEDNGGRSYDTALTGNALSNALYLKPQAAYRIVPGLWAQASFLAARTAKVPTAYRDAGRRAYGYEIDAGLVYNGLDHFVLEGTFGTFIPGSYYRNYEDDTYAGFKKVAFGGQIIARVQF